MVSCMSRTAKVQHSSRVFFARIVSAFDPAKRDIPGSNLILWTALTEALGANRDFDFEGSALRGVEH